MVSFEVIAILIFSAIFFFLGIFLLISGIFKFKINKVRRINKILIEIGLLLALPFLRMISQHFQQRDYEAVVIDNYVMEDSSAIALKVFQDKTFVLTKGHKCIKKGNGKWKVWIGDLPELILNLDSDPNPISYQITESNKKTKLIPIWSDQADILVKQ
jgi:hypothetical protein